MNKAMTRILEKDIDPMRSTNRSKWSKRKEKRWKTLWRRGCTVRTYPDQTAPHQSWESQVYKI